MSAQEATSLTGGTVNGCDVYADWLALPGGWTWAKLGDVCKTTSGGTPSRKNPEYFTGDIPWVKSGELPDGFVTEVEERITDDAVANSSAKLFPPGTLLIALYGATVGKLGILKEAATTNQAVCAIFPPEDLDTKYLFWYLRFIRSDLVAQAVGGAQPNISQGILRELPVPLAPLDQQKRIVAEIEKQFSRLDEGVNNLKRVKANFKRYKAAVLKAAVEGHLVETEAEIARREGRDYETGEQLAAQGRANAAGAGSAGAALQYETGQQLLERILRERRRKWEEAELAKMQATGKVPKNDKWKQKYKEPAAPDTANLPELPEGWVWASPVQLSSSEPYSLAIGPFGSNLKVSDYAKSGVPLVFIRNIRAASFGGPDTIYVTKEKAKELHAHRTGPGDLLITKMGDPPGDVCIYPAHRPEAIITSDCIKLRLAPETPSGQFFKYAIESQLVHNQILGITKGVAQLKVSLARFRSIALPLPPLGEQHRIVAEVDRRLSVLRETEAQVEANHQRAECLRQSILAAGFSGRLTGEAKEQDAA